MRSLSPIAASERVAAGAQGDALAAEARVVAHFPPAAAHDHRRCAIVEARALEVTDWRSAVNVPPLKAFVLEERDLRGCWPRTGDGAGHCKQS